MANEQTRQSSRWPCLILNLFAPGIGRIREGSTARGVAWFIGFNLLSLLSVLLLGTENIHPLIAPVVALLAFACMMKDNFRPGSMSLPRWLVFLAMLVGGYTISYVSTQVCRAFKHPTSSMEPTLLGIHEGSTPDHVIVNRLSYKFAQPARGDLLVFRTNGILGIRTPPGVEQYFIKRIIGLPGETIKINAGSVFANDKKLGAADGVPPITYHTFGAINTYTVGSNEYFVLGDFSENSADSRVWGQVPAANILGKVTKIYWPPSRWGKPEWTDEVKPRMPTPSS